MNLSPLSASPVPLIIALARGFGGVDVRVRDTARFLHEKGIGYRVLVLKQSPLHEKLVSEGLNALASSFSRGDPRNILWIVSAAREIGATVIDAHNMQSQYWSALAAPLARIRGRLATVHSVYRDVHAKSGRRALHEGALQLCHRSKFDFLSVSPMTTRYLMNIGICEDRLHTVMNGVEDLTSQPIPIDFRKDFGWHDYTFVVGAIGRLAKEKGFGDLIDAIRQIHSKSACQVGLVVVGEGNEESSLKQQVSRHGIESAVRFIGFRKDITDILASIDAICMPSYTEGLPYTLIEAIRQRVPCICSRVGGPSLLFSDERDVLFVEPGKPQEIADAIKRLSSSSALRKQLADGGRALFENSFQAGRMYEETLSLYEKLCRK